LARKVIMARKIKDISHILVCTACGSIVAFTGLATIFFVGMSLVSGTSMSSIDTILLG